MKLRDIIIIVVIAVSIFLVTRVVIQNFVVDGESMLPNLKGKEWVLVNKVVYKLHPPERGDIIVFNSPSASVPRVLIKRVIGLPGETVKIDNGNVYIDDKLLDESSYIDVSTARNGTWTLGEGKHFVLGDNRPSSSDSRTWGAVDQANIIGKAWLRIWPFSVWGFAPNYRPVLTE